MHSKFLNYDNIEDNNSVSTNLHGPNSQAYDSHSSPSSEPSPYHDTDSVTDKSKKIRKKRNTYQKIDDVTRMHLLDAVQQGETLKAAAKRYNINYSSAKSILHTYRKEGRILKKSAQERTSRRRVSKETSSDMEMSPIYLSKDCQEDFSANDESTVYESPESQHRSPPVFRYAQEEKPKSCFNNGVTINTFGGFLKIGVQQKSEEIAPKPAAAASTVVLKLDANSVNKSVNSTNGVQRGNWQLNFNVRNEQKPVEVPQAKSANVLAISEKLKSFESFYMNYSNSPLSRAIQIKKQDSQVDFAIPQDFTAFTDMITCNEDPFDVSCFLNASSPKLGCQRRGTFDFDPFAGGENFSWMDNWRGEGQEFFCDEPNKGLKGY